MYKRRRRTFIGSVMRFTNRQFPILVIILTGLILVYIAWIIYTTPEPYKDTVPDNQICLVDDLPEDTFDYSSFTSYDELFPKDYEYGKDGEVLIEEGPILSAIPDIPLNLAPMPYFPSVVPTVPPDINKPPVGEITIMANKMKAEYHDPVIAREMLNLWIEEETNNRILQDVEENGL